jgi:hypothetical protein
MNWVEAIILFCLKQINYKFEEDNLSDFTGE